ncbi:expressed unknown protein [Seminavis robusta]|uniref:Uncharacterized protein n=1 Tax=Seminavis robusta TaxID=568900 RepID=A0A9N8EF93_9STRA|nr:expressed unknown protein [Seminavis robusta]|eukprot:Sro992_g228820.1 n/a (187) ;mRNA; r:21145-21848
MEKSFGRDKETGFTQNFTKSEFFESFQKYMDDQRNTAVSEEDFPVHNDSTSKSSSSKPSGVLLDDKEIHMQGNTDDSAEDPDNQDFCLKWLTSRAKWEVSKKTSPAGQIMHRVRTRLGARDHQCKIAKLIKRAGNLGLIPQSVNLLRKTMAIYESGIHAMKPWEEELQRSGLIITPKEIKNEKSEW